METKEENQGKEMNAFQEVYEKVQSTDSSPIEASDCEVQEEVHRINLDKETADRG